jgi:hypothetical protein
MPMVIITPIPHLLEAAAHVLRVALSQTIRNDWSPLHLKNLRKTDDHNFLKITHRVLLVKNVRISVKTASISSRVISK